MANSIDEAIPEDQEVEPNGAMHLDSNQYQLPSPTSQESMAREIVYKDISDDELYDIEEVKNDILQINQKSKSIDNINTKTAWLSTDIIIDEINVNQQYFKIQGDLFVFWRDKYFDPDDKLRELDRYKSHPNELINILFSSQIKRDTSKS